MKSFFPISLILLALVLAGCSSASASSPGEAAVPLQGDADLNSSTDWGGQTPLLDEQGAVTAEITPLNLANPGDALDFQVSLNTHSVDLSMNLTNLATLTTDTGKTVQAVTWDAPLGGHHVSGTLSFPASVDGVPVLEGVSKLTLTLVNVDVPERVFIWER